eukprot:CAMPEP_0178984862 /NCGR_PEP_ID=MMETSP0795-20121207/1844_1 /TAXON_ID=88552 /ORGANISM="Amoebophrya sp., Strain Ameob2" /LENGTH=138 /DNA_ID=CAMNT_0020675779 /DNA_START=377 /DNA_END=793 /DNA_ORIENTATION=+
MAPDIFRATTPPPLVPPIVLVLVLDSPSNGLLPPNATVTVPPDGFDEGSGVVLFIFVFDEGGAPPSCTRRGSSNRPRATTGWRTPAFLLCRDVGFRAPAMSRVGLAFVSLHFGMCFEGCTSPFLAAFRACCSFGFCRD